MGLFDVIGAPFKWQGELAGSVVGGLAGGISDAAGLKNDFQARPYGMTPGQWVPGQGGGLAALLGGHYQQGGIDPALQSAFTYNDPNAPAYGQAAQQAQQQGAQAFAGQQAIQNRQGGLADLLTMQAQGRGPSVADAQLQQALGRSRDQAASIAANAVGQGVSPALATQLAQQAAASNAQQASADSATMRVNETLAGRSQLGQLLAQQQQGQLAQQGLSGNQALNYYGMGQQGAMFGAQSQQSLQQLLAQQYAQSQAINAGVASGNSQLQGQIVGGLLNAGGQVAAMGVGGKPG